MALAMRGAMRAARRCLSTDSQRFTVTLFPGDGIGPEIADSVGKVFEAAEVPIDWEPHIIDVRAAKPGESPVSRDALDSVLRNGFALKGPMATPIGKGHRSLNLTLRKELGLYANIRPAVTFPGVKTLYHGVDVVTVRENTEGEYSGLEHVVAPGVVESLKVITRTASTRIAEYAFEYAAREGRQRVTAVHKATVMRLSDGLFLECCREIAEKYKDKVAYDELLIDNAASFLVANPAQLDVMVMPNLYGDIISDLCAGLIGGLGLTPSCNIGKNVVMAEAVHGTAPDIVGQGKANPTALLMSGLMMLRHMKLAEKADMIEKSVFSVLTDGKYKTGDLGGSASSDEYTKAIIGGLQG